MSSFGSRGGSSFVWFDRLTDWLVRSSALLLSLGWAPQPRVMGSLDPKAREKRSQFARPRMCSAEWPLTAFRKVGAFCVLTSCNRSHCFQERLYFLDMKFTTVLGENLALLLCLARRVSPLIADIVCCCIASSSLLFNKKRSRERTSERG